MFVKRQSPYVQRRFKIIISKNRKNNLKSKKISRKNLEKVFKKKKKKKRKGIFSKRWVDWFKIGVYVTLRHRGSFFCSVRDKTKLLLTTLTDRLPIVHGRTTSACHTCHSLSCKVFIRNQIFGHLRFNCGELLEFRLFHRLILTKTLQNLVKFYEVAGDKETGEWN